jgi:hypothetical protein
MRVKEQDNSQPIVTESDSTDKPPFDLAYAMSELESPENQILSMLLKKLGPYPVYKIIDKNGMNLLHHAVLKGVEGKTQLLIDFAKNY